MKNTIKIGDEVMGIMGVDGGYAGTVFAIKHDGRHKVAFFRDEEGVVYETPLFNLTKNVPPKGTFPRKNPMNPKGVYTTYKSWLAAAKKAGAVRLDGDKDIAMAFDASGRGVAEWDGAEGYIYKSAVRENPVRPRKGEPSRAFVSRCMSEEKMSFPEPKQRIAVCLSKSRKRNPVYDTGSDE